MTHPKLNLRSIEEEAAACRKAFEGFAVGGKVRHCHHSFPPVETLAEPAEHRIAWILSQKPENERALRLRLFRPLTEEQAKTYGEARAKAHKTYNEMVAMASKAHAKALAMASKAHAKALAAARKAYNEALATASKAYAEVLVAADKAYDKALAKAHAQICVPGCPWNGYTIFAERK